MPRLTINLGLTPNDGRGDKLRDAFVKVNSNFSELYDMRGVQGAVGAQGARGAQGAQGAVGVQGVQGAVGAQGVQGAIGAQGDVGAQGAVGVQGVQGAIGPIAGSNTQITFNNSGSASASPNLTFNVATNALTVIGTANVRSIVTSNNLPLLDLSQTWNNSSATFTATKLNVTDTASVAGSLLMDLQVGGVSKFSVDKTGKAQVPTINGQTTLNIGESTTGFGNYSGNGIDVATGGVNRIRIRGGEFRLKSDTALGFSAGDPTALGADLTLYRDAANTLAQRLGTANQTFRVYNSYTDASNYSRLAINSNQIASEVLGTGSLLITADKPVLNLSQEWSNSSVTFSAAKINVTDTASGSASNLLDLQVGGVSRLFVDKNARVWSNQPTTSTTSNFVAQQGASGTWFEGRWGASLIAGRLRAEAGVPFLDFSSGGAIRWYNNFIGTATLDAVLLCDSANTLAQRNGTANQVFRVYNSYTDANNYSRLAINANQIASEANGTGTLAITSDRPILNLAQTWNNTSVVFTATKINVTDTASDATSKLMDLQTGGTSRFSVRKDGAITLRGSSNPGDISVDGAGRIIINSTAGGGARIYSDLILGAGSNITLAPDASNILAQRNGTANQAFRVYNTYTDASNYERATIGWSGSLLQIGTEATGTGTLRSLNLVGSNVYVSTGTTPATQFQVTDVAGATRSVDARGGIAGSSFPAVGTGGGTESFGVFSNSNSIHFSTGGYNTTRALTIAHTASAVNYLTINSAIAGGNVNFTATGSSTDIGINLVPKGNGIVQISGSANIGLTAASTSNSAPLLDLSQTWNNSSATFTATRLNVTDTASGASSLLMDLQTGGTPRFGVLKDGAVYSQGSTINKHFSIYSNGGGFACSNFGALLSASSYNAIYGGYGPRFANDVTIQWSAAATITGSGGSPDLVISRKGTANLQFGGADAAAPVPQTIGPQSVVAGTTDTAGANFTIRGSQGTGTGAGGDIIFQVAPAGTTGTAQNALVTALTINKAGNKITVGTGTAGFGDVSTGLGLYARQSGSYSLSGIIREDIIAARSAAAIGWSSTDNLAAYSFDLTLYRDSANTLAQRNGTANQAFRIYNTYTDASNYERLELAWNSNTPEIISKSAGTGTTRGLNIGTFSATNLNFLSSNLIRWRVDGSGHFIAAADNTYDIGASGATRPRNIYTANSVNSPSYQLDGSGVITDSTITRTLSSTDNGKMIYFTNSSAITVTTANTLVSGFSCGLIQANTGQITIVAGASTTVNSFAGLVKTAGQFAMATVFSPVANTFIVAGNLA
jgi:hypothetical protein